MGQGCSFFQWADEDGPPAQGRGFGSRGRGAEGRGRGFGRGASGGGRGGKKRKCGHCRMEGDVYSHSKYVLTLLKSTLVLIITLLLLL